MTGGRTPELELLALDLSAVRVAGAIGAARVELCQALELGGVTPSAGLLRGAVAVGAALGVEVHVLIRPRGGHFVFSEDEMSVMLGDVETAVSAGASGVVLGCLDADGRIHEAQMRQLRDRAGALQISAHRAVDLAEDPVRAVETVCDLGFARVLTSGGADTADAGRVTLGRMLERVGGRIQVMAGGGVTAENAPGLAALGVDALHFSAKRTVERPGSVQLGSADSGGGYQTVDAERAEQIARAVRGARA